MGAFAHLKINTLHLGSTSAIIDVMTIAIRTDERALYSDTSERK